MNTSLRHFCFLFLLNCISICHAQIESNFIKLDKPFVSYAPFTEDHFGHMVFIAGNGIYTYNGYNFIHKPLTTIFGNDFTRDSNFFLTKDSKNNLWLSSFKGELTQIRTNGEKTSFKEALKTNDTYTQITYIKTNGDTVWFGSVNGVVYKHLLGSNTIKPIFSLPKMDNTEQSIKTIALTSSNELWVSTTRGYIYKYSIITNSLEFFDKLKTRGAQGILITNDNLGRLWIVTELDGLHCYNPKDDTLKQYDITKNNKTSQFHMFNSLFCDRAGTIWAGTDGDGLYSIDTKNDELTIFKHNENDEFSISDNTILYITEDSKNNIWVMAKKGVINILPKNTNKIKYYNGLEHEGSTTVLSILKSSDGTLYLGTDGKGLNKVSPNHKKTQYSPSQKGDRFFKGRYIQTMVEDANGNIWLGTYQNGVWIYNPKTNHFNKIGPANISSPDIRMIFKDSKNRIWVAFETALYVFNSNQKLLATFNFNDKGLFGKICMAINEDEHGFLWIGLNPARTGSRPNLYKLNEDAQDLNQSYFTKHNYFTYNPEDVRNYNIHSIKPDQNGNLWILCASGMLIKYNINNDSFKSFANNKHLSNTYITSLLIEDPNNLWLSSSNGIHHYNLTLDKLKSYYRIDGLHNTNFYRRSDFKDRNGMLYFGGDNGVNAFLPSEIEKNDTEAKLFINDIEILNKPASNIIPEQVSNGSEYVKNLNLNYDQSSFSFQFSALGNLINTDYHYAYRLNGFDKEWITPREERTATYTNIPYGNYTFEVKAGSKRDEWNIDPISISLFIKPPWWHSTWAYLLYLVIGSFVIYGFWLWFNLKNKLIKETWQNNKEKELYALKMNFFAKMSHEIQTPLTLILGPIGDMLKRAGDNGNKLLQQRLLMINNNANRLSRIAMELMTVRNKELGKLRVYASKNNLIKDLKRIALSFSEQARFKNIHFIQQYPEQTEINIWYDSDKIEHVIYNLLSNAFKFTPKEGTISLKVAINEPEELVEILVRDSGPGIPKEELEDIFKLFYQSDLGKHNKGIGVGLALTKELISLHKGEINVKSSPENGTCFSVKLSTKDTIFSEDEKIFVEDSNMISNSIEDEFKALETNYSIKTNTEADKNHTLLIVEDNIEMQMFLRDVLSNAYHLLIASNGKEGIELAEKHVPDLIISDIMMPVVDGFEMCKLLQKKKVTAHIPIILLTAKNSSSTKIKGLQIGAIEYIKKPFNFHELQLKINNILKAKEKAISKYKTDLISNPEHIKEPSKDELFMEKLVNELNQQLENPGFKLEDLTKAFNMSYSVIFRKYQDITGKTLIDLVKSLRLKKAALLIIQNGYSISEAAYTVGYKDAKYFTKSFKEEFGIPPASFKRESKDMDWEDLAKKYNIEYHN
ncbi:two-component regulator propeller domain-containing protein [Aestuariivivens insulae]|uniref:two-component regulator propeller domain-containing protein n=1 Tax=Aestuariivivens insulae TaxID=1621988 RepID=UPI001F5820AA|nr:two-component regulator propeller domain-containing protein [Aestuariivivens insulae]